MTERQKQLLVHAVTVKIEQLSSDVLQYRGVKGRETSSDLSELLLTEYQELMDSISLGGILT